MINLFKKKEEEEDEETGHGDVPDKLTSVLSQFLLTTHSSQTLQLTVKIVAQCLLEMKWFYHQSGLLPVSLRECREHVPAGSLPCVLTFLSPEKMTVRSYRSCLARDRREGRGEGRVGLK